MKNPKPKWKRRHRSGDHSNRHTVTHKGSQKDDDDDEQHLRAKMCQRERTRRARTGVGRGGDFVKDYVRSRSPRLSDWGRRASAVENFRKICCSFFWLSDQFILCCFLLAENSPIMERNTGARESKREQERERERDLLACWKFSNFGERDGRRERKRDLLAGWNFSNFVERDEERERSACLLDILQLWRKRWRETQ